MQKINIVSGVYLIKHNPTDDTYVGSSFNIHHRFEQHMMERSKWFASNKEDFELYLLEACGPDKLKDREQYYINTLNPTLNINKSTTRPPHAVGASNTNALYGESTYEKIFTYLATGDNVKDVAQRLNVSTDVVRRIYSLKSHTYLHSKFPEEHKQLVQLREYRNKTLPLKVYHEEHGEHTLCRPFSNFCTKFNLPNNGNISRLYNGTRKSYLGWRLSDGN